MLEAKCTRSIWSIAVERANSRVFERAVEIWAYSLSAIMPLSDSEKALKAGGTVWESSARSTTESVADWPGVPCAQAATKSSTIILPRSSVEIEVFFESAVIQLV